MADDNEFKALQEMLAASQAMVAAQAQRIAELTELSESLSSQLQEWSDNDDAGDDVGNDSSGTSPMGKSANDITGKYSIIKAGDIPLSPGKLAELMKAPPEISRKMRDYLGIDSRQPPERGDRLIITVDKDYLDESLIIAVRSTSSDLQAGSRISTQQVYEMKAMPHDRYTRHLVDLAKRIAREAVHGKIIYKELEPEAAETIHRKLARAIGRGIAQ